MKFFNVTFPRLLIFSLLFLWSGCIAGKVKGQPFAPTVDPYRFGVSYFPSDAGMRFRWVASDLSSSPVSSWTDRISGSVMTQATGANQPTWSTDGVAFDGSNDFLTITNFTAGASVDNWGVLVVLKFNSTAASQMVLGNLAGSQVYLGIASSGYFHEKATLGDLSLGLLPTTAFDFFTCKTTNAVNPYRSHTNGLSGWVHSGAWNENVPWPRLGRGNGNAPFNGVVKEIIVWTNYTFTAAQIGRIHEYATNTYGITP